MRVAVVGGGIAGLSAAWELRGEAEVTLFEPAALGGRIRTEEFDGRPVESGPDAFITRVPEGLALCNEAGVDDLVSPAAGSTLLWWQDRLRPLPEGLVLGVPRRLGPVARSGLLSPLGLLRAGADLVLPGRPPSGDVSVRELVASRFGSEVADRLVEPLVGSIHAGTTGDLSAETTVPQLLAAVRHSRSLLLGLRRQAGAASRGDAVFATPRRGLTALVDAVRSGLLGAGVSLARSAVDAIEQDRAGGWRLEPVGQRFDRVVLAVAAPQAARILGPDAPGGLKRVDFASVVLVTLGYADLIAPPGINGVLVPRQAGLLSTACSFGSSKWPHWAAPGRTLLRVSAGRAGDERAMQLDDSTLVERLAGEVARLLSTEAEPDRWRVSRWPASFPQYRVGHQALVAGIESDLHRLFPGVAVCGSSYRGAGIPACIASGRSAARAVLAAGSDA